MAHILIVEDDPDIASLLQRGLASAGHQSHWVESTEDGEAAVEEQAFDAAIIDMILGEDSGAAMLATLRARGHRLPAIMLSALSRIEDRADGLEAGAQDYVVKPFQLSELLARLEVQLHRAAPRDKTVSLGALKYDPDTRQVTGAGRVVVMTEREGDLLRYLIERPGQVLTRGEIFDEIWVQHGGATENVVDVYLGYLRRKLQNFEPYGLQMRTVRGRGFMLLLQEDAR